MTYIRDRKWTWLVQHFDSSSLQDMIWCELARFKSTEIDQFKWNFLLVLTPGPELAPKKQFCSDFAGSKAKKNSIY